MALPNIFKEVISEKIIQRISNLSKESKAQWGTMNAAQMLAHCCVTYEMIFETKHPKPGLLMGLMLKLFVKKYVVSEVPYKKSSRTAPAFIITDSRDFEAERNRLIKYIEKSQQLGEGYFDGRASNSFGVLSITEWNNMFYKHLDHHLSQFGV